MTTNRKVLSGIAMLAAFLILLPAFALSHCDTMDGPVVKAAKKALETGNVNYVLLWVQKKDEAEIKKAFQKALVVRKAGPEARDLADLYFFETLVRVHRAGEGAAYTGLKPAGLDLGPAIPAADKAIESGRADALLKLITDAFQENLKESFQDVLSKKSYKPDDIEAGRSFIRAYVEYVHYAERLFEAATTKTEGHYPEEKASAAPKHIIDGPGRTGSGW